METVIDFFFLSSKITANSDCSHKIKICLLLGRKAMTNLDNLLHHFANKGPISQSYDFSSSHVWMWELDYKESWALKNWCFWTVVLEKTRESSLACKEIKPVNPKGNLSWIVTGSTDAKLKLKYFGHRMWRTDSLKRPWCWERLKTGREEGDRGWDSWMASLTQWTWVWASSGSWWWTEKPGVLQSMRLQRVGHDWANELTD